MTAVHSLDLTRVEIRLDQGVEAVRAVGDLICPKSIGETCFEAVRPQDLASLMYVLHEHLSDCVQRLFELRVTPHPPLKEFRDGSSIAVSPTTTFEETTP
jgi:hypothetical protein